MFVPLPAYQTGKTTEAREDVAGDSKRIRARGSTKQYVTLFFTAFFLCFIVMCCSFIPGLGDGNIRRRKSKRDVCDLQRTSLPLQVTVLVLGEQIRR